MPTIQIIGRDGFTIAKSTTITSAQSIHAVALMDAVKQARELIRFTEGQQDVTHLSGTPDEYHPMTIKALLPCLGELLSQALPVSSAMYSTAAHLSHNDPAYDYMNNERAVPSVDSLAMFSPVNDWLQQGRNLGFLLANENEPYDRVELVGAGGVHALRWR